MSKRKNLFTRIGRPPAPKNETPARHPSTGERQGKAPMDGFDSAIPGRAYRQGGSVRYHDDPNFCGPPKNRR